MTQLESYSVQCPWCFEGIEICLSPEDAGSMVEDCQVCCRPCQVYVERPEETAGTGGESSGGAPTLRLEHS